MITKDIGRSFSFPMIVIIVILLLACQGVAQAEVYTGPIKEILSTRIGREVNKITKANRCVVAAEECQSGRQSSELGGFEFAKSVAVDNNETDSAHYGHVYVIDNSHRVQEFTPDGVFISMFGWDVNETKVVKGGATQQEMNICTKTEIEAGAECEPGVEGSTPGQIGESSSSKIAIDKASGDVYITERFFGQVGGERTEGRRVQKFTAGGEFILEIGKEVNETTKANLCTQEEVVVSGVRCGGATMYAGGIPETAEPGAFADSEALTVGGPEGNELLYVGDEHRVQEFELDGEYKGEISLSSISAANHSHVTSIAVDKGTGDVYLVYEEKLIRPATIREFTANGKEVKNSDFPRTLKPRIENAFNFSVSSLAVDTSGTLAVTELEEGENERFEKQSIPFGSLLKAGTGQLITEFAVPTKFGSPVGGVAFGPGDEMIAASEQEILVYTPEHVAELIAKSVTCSPGAENETDVTFACGLGGEANPEGVSNTDAWFEWGTTEDLGEVTATQSVCMSACGSVPVSLTSVRIEGRPDQTFHVRVAGRDENVKAPETLSSEAISFSTQAVAPRIVGLPSAPFVRSSSVVLSGELNPENTSTEYFFEYGTQLDDCQGRLKTRGLQSAAFGKIGITAEVTGLQPTTTYAYALCAKNDKGAVAVGEKGEVQIPEGTFTTAEGPNVQAQTGSASTIGTVSAVVSGSINPDGVPATYEFELGVYNGSLTQYGVVFSEAVGADIAPIEEHLTLTGLQAGTTYAYRIKISSPGYGTADGATVLFRTEGLPAVLVPPVPPAQLAVPNVAFPKSPPASKKKAKKPAPKKAKKKSKTEKSKARKSSGKGGRRLHGQGVSKTK